MPTVPANYLRKLIIIPIISLIICSTTYADEQSDNKNACRDEDPGYACQYKNSSGYAPGVCEKSSDGSGSNVCVPKVNSQDQK